MKRAGLLVLCAALVAGCSDAPTDVWAGDLEEGRRRWQAAGIGTYQFDFRISCFCLLEYTMPVRITVQNGVFATIVYRDTGLAVDSALFRDYLTIDRVFASLRQVLDSDPASFAASYDPARGFPVTVSVDLAANAVDDEFTITVSNFQVPVP
jgi:hypothetical protein